MAATDRQILRRQHQPAGEKQHAAARMSHRGMCAAAGRRARRGCGGGGGGRRNYCRSQQHGTIHASSHPPPAACRCMLATEETHRS